MELPSQWDSSHVPPVWDFDAGAPLDSFVRNLKFKGSPIIQSSTSRHMFLQALLHIQLKELQKAVELCDDKWAASFFKNGVGGPNNTPCHGGINIDLICLCMSRSLQNWTTIKGADGISGKSTAWVKHYVFTNN